MPLAEKIKLSEPYNRLFQCLVAIIANCKMGVPIDENFHPHAIFKYEGGVVVNGREIVIYHLRHEDDIYCRDDWEDAKGKAEVAITREVVLELLYDINWRTQEDIIGHEKENGEAVEAQVRKLFEKYKISYDLMLPEILRFCRNPFGDPLRSLYRP